jgi:hypothetical protein
MGAPVKASWWVKDAMIVKDHIITKYKNKPKILLLSGSNSLYGVDSKQLSHELSMPTINLATHFNMGLSYFIFQAKKYVKKGDIVIMPLEFVFYDRASDYTAWFVNNIIAWNDPYFYQLSLIEQINFIYHTSPKRIIEGLLAQTLVKNTPKEILKKRTLSQSFILKDIQKRWKTNNLKSSYSYASIGKQGDIEKNIGIKKKMRTYKTSYMFNNLHLTKNFLHHYKQLKELSVTRGFTLVLTWPVTLENSRFSTKHNPTLAHIQAFENQLRQNDIDLLGTLQDFHYERKYFYDSGYHLNTDGKKLRTQKLASLLKQHIIF